MEKKKWVNNYIGIDEEPAIMFEKAMRIPDDCLETYFKLTTDVDAKIYNKWIEEDIVNAHKEFGKEIIRMYHGEEFIESAVNKYEAKASKKITDDIDTITLSNKLPISLIDLLVEINIASSKSEARRLIEQNGVSINGVKENNVSRVITTNDLIEGHIIVQKGKKVFIKIIFE